MAVAPETATQFLWRRSLQLYGDYWLVAGEKIVSASLVVSATEQQN